MKNEYFFFGNLPNFGLTPPPGRQSYYTKLTNFLSARSAQSSVIPDVEEVGLVPLKRPQCPLWLALNRRTCAFVGGCLSGE